MSTMHKANMIFYLILLIFIPSLLAELTNVFNSEDIIEKENDPIHKTIFDEYIIRFNSTCLKGMEIHTRDIIQEFLDEFECYQLNEDEGKVDEYPDIIDHWIVMNKIVGCDDEDEKELKLDEFCIESITENEEIEAYGTNQCLSRNVGDRLWNLDQGTPSILDGFEYIEFDPLFEPNMVIIVVDTGIDYTHPEFVGITYELLFDAYPTDPLGYHGTHVAATIVGKNYGVMRAEGTQIKLIDVAVLGPSGATWTDLYNALDAIINYLDTISPKKAIINMSLGGPNTVGINERLAEIRQKGGISIVSAGNWNVDAKLITPASSNDTITVGAHNQNNERSEWPTIWGESNYGDAIDIWAPGTDILSALPNNGSASAHGTSMASPFVAGIAANILANNQGLDYDGILNELYSYAIYDIDDRLGNTGLPRAQIECGEYCDLDGSVCDLYIDEIIVPPEDKTCAEAQKYCKDEYGTNLATIRTNEDRTTAIAALNEAGKEIGWIGLYSSDIHTKWQFRSGAECPSTSHYKCVDFWLYQKNLDSVFRPRCIDGDKGFGCAYFDANQDGVDNDAPVDVAMPFLCDGA